MLLALKISEGMTVAARVCLAVIKSRLSDNLSRAVSTARFQKKPD
jgi:hypothetical protein